MISVETILLLQQKVESAVQKIEQLKSENDALRAERSELTKALSEKSELLSRFSADEKKIEDGILGALNRLDAVENALLDSTSQATLADSSEGAAAAVQPTTERAAPAQPAQAEAAPAAPVQEQASFASPVQQAEATQAAEAGDDLFGDDSFETQEESVPDIF
ncbi:MAG: cell division protein ZapB [Treponema sp.]|nr:cell division protein ZapB [Treponema sp.]MEE3434795.1 cell division protein ZapB [Treponema sp.]